MNYLHLRYSSGEIINVLTAAHICRWKVVPRDGGGLPIDRIRLGYDEVGFYYKDDKNEIIESSVSWNPCGRGDKNARQAEYIISLVRERDNEYYRKVLYECYHFPESDAGKVHLPYRWLVTAALIAWRQLDFGTGGKDYDSKVYYGV